MVEITVGLIAAAALLYNTRLNVKMKREMKVSNGIPPGFMIEKTYERVQDIRTELAVHKVDPDAHGKRE